MINYPRLIADLHKHGVKTDAAANEALTLIEAARAARNSAPISDLRAAYESGAITSDNVTQAITQAATLAVAAGQIHAAAAAVEDGANGTLRRWLGSREDQIIKTLRKPFNDAADRVQLAARHFAPDASSDQILAGGSPAVAAREGLAEALDTLNQIRALRVQVADCAGNSQQDATWYIEGAPDLDALDAAHRAYTGAGNAFHALAHAGFTLRLNTLTEAARIAAGARTVSEAREAEARAARVAELRDGWPAWNGAA